MKKKQIGDIIRELRKREGKTQEQLAEILGISTPAISKWENGLTNPDISMLPIIARYFNTTIDFLLDFSNKINSEDMKKICKDVVENFINLEFKDAEKEWSNYLLQHPNNYTLMYELATIAIFNMQKSGSIEKLNLFAHRLINVFEKCIDSDDLKIKQGSYFQIANLYILLQDYDKAQTILDKIPEQLVNPNFLLSMIYINKGEFEKANKNIQENIYTSLNNIIGELSNMISAIRMVEDKNIDKVLKLAYKQKQITYIFGLEPINGIGIGLQIALLLAQKEEYKRVKIELEQVLDILEKYPKGISSINNIDFFKDTDFKVLEGSNTSFPAYGYSILVDQIFDLIREEYDFQEIKSRLEKALS